jgi:hypothetical protein
MRVFQFPLLALCLLAALLSGCAKRNTAPAWNVPSLLGQNGDALSKQLGAHRNQSTLDATRTQRTWIRDGQSLQVEWKNSSKRVTSFTLMSRDDANAVREEEKTQLLAPGQLQENDPRYTLEYIEAKERPLFYTGVKVIPAPRNHNVVLRVTATQSMLQVTTQISGQTESVLTIPPWEKTLSLPDDAQIGLAVRLQKNLTDAPQVPMKAEIVVDGKVVASAASGGPPIQCGWEI